METKRAVWDLDYEESDVPNMKVKHKYDKVDKSDREMDRTRDLSGNTKREYDTRNEEGGYLGKSRNSGGTVGFKVSSDFAIDDSNDNRSKPLFFLDCKLKHKQHLQLDARHLFLGDGTLLEVLQKIH